MSEIKAPEGYEIFVPEFTQTKVRVKLGIMYRDPEPGYVWTPADGFNWCSDDLAEYIFARPLPASAPAGSEGTPLTTAPGAVRRLTPREC